MGINGGQEVRWRGNQSWILDEASSFYLSPVVPLMIEKENWTPNGFEDPSIYTSTGNGIKVIDIIHVTHIDRTIDGVCY